MKIVFPFTPYDWLVFWYARSGQWYENYDEWIN